MNEATVLTMLGALCSILFGLICALIGYGGNKIIQKMDQLYERVDGYVNNLHVRINGIDTRVTVLETRCRSRHDDPQ